MEILLFVFIGIFSLSFFFKMLRKVVKLMLFIFVLLWVYNTFFAEVQAFSVETWRLLC